MHGKNLMLAVLASALVFTSGVGLAADQDQDRTRLRDKASDQARDQDRLHDRDQEMIYGNQLMTEKERDEYRSRMRAARTQQERKRIRSEHHERMKVRAKERGVSIPDEPPGMGGGMMRPGGGMGPGGGGARR